MSLYNHLNDYPVCDLTLLHFNTSYKQLISKYVQEHHAASRGGIPLSQNHTLEFTLRRIAYELEFKLNEFIKSELKCS